MLARVKMSRPKIGRPSIRIGGRSVRSCKPVKNGTTSNPSAVSIGKPQCFQSPQRLCVERSGRVDRVVGKKLVQGAFGYAARLELRADLGLAEAGLEKHLADKSRVLFDHTANLIGRLR